MTRARSVVLSALAERRLIEIAEYTAKRYGAAQVLTYETEIAERLAAAAKGRARLRPLASLSGQDRHESLFVLRAGQHFLILAQRSDHLLVLDIVHTRSDLTALNLED